MYAFDYDVADSIATIKLNRPERLNALTLEIYAQLRDLFADLQHDDSVKVVIITGAGRAFCAGGDVHEIIGVMFERDTLAHLEFCRMTGHLVRNMRLLEKPIIAAVNGTAAGAGAVIALASDLRVVSEDAISTGDRDFRALLSHIATYTLAFLPALVWLASEIDAWVIGVAALIAGPHLVQDDGRVLDFYITRVKGLGARSQPTVAAAVDQSFHVLALFLLALLAGE